MAIPKQNVTRLARGRAIRRAPRNINYATGVLANTPTGQLGAPAAPTAPPAPSQASPLDSTYIANEAQSTWTDQQRLTELDRQESYENTDYQEALRRLRERKPREVEGARSSRNRQGLFYSGHLGRDLGDIDTSHIRQEGDMAQQQERRRIAREEARRAIREGASLREAAERAAAVDRQTARDQQAASERALVDEAPLTDPEKQGGAMGAPTGAAKSFLPPGYMQWSPQMKSRYWARKRRERSA